MSPLENGILSFLSTVELVKEADLGMKYMLSRGYDRETQRLYKEYRDMEAYLQRGYHGGERRAPGGAAANRMRARQAEIGRELRKRLKKGDAKILFTGTKEVPGLGQRGFAEGAWAKPSKGEMLPVHQKTITGPRGQQVFSPREKAEIGTQQMAPERQQHLREMVHQNKIKQRTVIPISAQDKYVQDYMNAHKGRAPSKRHLKRRAAALEIRGGPTRDWSWSAGQDMRPQGSQPYYSKGGPSIKDSPLGAQPGDPARTPTGGSSRIPGPRPGEAAPGTAGVGARPKTHAMAAPEAAAAKPGFLSRLKGRVGRVGRVGAVAGGLALLGGGLLAYNANKKRQGNQMQPQYGPMPMPLASAQYGGSPYGGYY